MERRSSLILLVCLAFVFMGYMTSMDSADLPPLENNIELKPKLSDYHIFEGPAATLKPAAGFKYYQLATTLFTDYAEKQRLIKLPEGTKLTAVNNGLPDFPDGTILVKTFYYYNDVRDTSHGKQILETRIMIKNNSKWSGGTYQWNKGQTEAILITKGLDVPVSWTNKEGSAQSISYHIPKTKECATCHNADNVFMPIGPKVMNLNRDVIVNNKKINQLAYLQQEELLNKVDPSSFQKLPDWQDTSLPLEDRARAYLDVNCAHCHSEKGYCADSRVRLGAELSLNQTHISNNTGRIDRFMAGKRMPMLGTTIVHKEGLELIQQYLNTLK